MKQNPLKRDNNISDRKSKILSYFLIIVGNLLIIIGFILLILEKNISKDVVNNFGLGLIFLILGIYQLKNKQIYETKWKDITLGFKVIITYLFISFTFSFLNLHSTLKQPIVLFGIIINFPSSILLHLFSFSILLIIILLIYSKKGWKWILGLELFNVITIISTIAWFLLTPLTRIFDVMNQTLPEISAETLQSIELSVKLTSLIPAFIGLTFGLVILFYVYKNKEYFSNDK